MARTVTTRTRSETRLPEFNFHDEESAGTAVEEDGGGDPPLIYFT